MTNNESGITAYAIATLHDAPHADLARLTLETMEAPVHSVLLRRNASGGWVGDRSHDEIMKEGAGSTDDPFSETFANMLGFGSPSGLKYLADAFDLAILAASRGWFEPDFEPCRLQLDFHLLWRRPAGFLRLRSRTRGSPAQELWAHFGDTEHRPGQGIVRVTTDDFRFFGDLLRRGA